MMLTGRIGGKMIVNDDINNFFEQIKDLDWTDNNIYKPAKIVEVKPTFSVEQHNSNQGHFQSKLGFFDQFLVEDNSNHLNDFKTYKNDVESKRIRVSDRINSQKDEFLQSINLDGVDDSSKKSEILDSIKNNLSQVVNNNNKLKEKIGSLVNMMDSQNNQNNQNQSNQGNQFNQGNNSNFNNNFGMNNNNFGMNNNNFGMNNNNFGMNNNNFNNQMGRGSQYGFNNNNMNSFGNNQFNNQNNHNQQWMNSSNQNNQNNQFNYNNANYNFK